MSPVVISTGFNAPTKQLCIDSVRNQTVKARHIYIEASLQVLPTTICENVRDTCMGLDPDDIVFWLDGDDEFAHSRVIARVMDLYGLGADVTYGSFRFSDGRIPAMRAYENARNCRKEPWLASHLRTFRAGLMQSVPESELMFENEWINMACDHAVMFPILELARCPVFCPDVLAIYHYETSWEHRFSTQDRAREAAIVRDLRSRKGLARP